MSHAAIIATALAAAFAVAAHADPIDPCSLLTPAEMAELGLPKDAGPSRELQPGGVRACKYQPAGSVSVVLSQAAPERVFLLRAMQAKARQDFSTEQLQARGEYFQDGVMCKVASAGGREISQCIGASGLSVIALTASRPDGTGKAAYPSSQLRIIATLVARVASQGG